MDRDASQLLSSLEIGDGLGGGIVECATRRSLWIANVEVSEIAGATSRARKLGTSVLLEPREGLAGWRSVVATPAGGEVAFIQRGHLASERCIARAGFIPAASAPDQEGMVDWIRKPLR